MTSTRLSFLLHLGLLLATAPFAHGQTLLFEDNFDDGTIDPNLWEVLLPFTNSNIVETGGVLRITNRGWLISSQAVGALGQDLIVEGEFQPEIQQGSYADSWRVFLHASVMPAGHPYNENTDGLIGSWSGGPGVGTCGITAAGSVQTPGDGGAAVGGTWKGFRMTTMNGVARYEMWDLANPADTVTYESTYSTLAGAGDRILFYNREAIGATHVTLLDNVRVFLAQDCNANGVPDAEDVASGASADCDLNNVPDECDIAANPALDSNTNGILDSCECTAANYCQASVNSAGTSAGIGWQGELSLSANNFSLGVSGAPPLKFGIYFYGANQTQMPLGEGQLCVALDVQRIQPLVITDQQGTALMPIDLTSAAFSSGPFAVTPFSTWNFQFWYRDPAGGPAGFNFSDGLEVTFCP